MVKTRSTSVERSITTCQPIRGMPVARVGVGTTPTSKMSHGSLRFNSSTRSPRPPTAGTNVNNRIPPGEQHMEFKTPRKLILE
uniref:Uncharacterized protein n=1 Tax=Cannabis sativa TaxID=3483 RepID=A0A803PAB7_CANSA